MCARVGGEIDPRVQIGDRVRTSWARYQRAARDPSHVGARQACPAPAVEPRLGWPDDSRVPTHGDPGRLLSIWLQLANSVASRDVAFGALDLDWQKYVELDPRYQRLTEVGHLLGDASKARKKLGWNPTVTFKALIEMMVKEDEEDMRASLAGRAPRQ